MNHCHSFTMQPSVFIDTAKKLLIVRNGLFYNIFIYIFVAFVFHSNIYLIWSSSCDQSDIDRWVGLKYKGTAICADNCGQIMQWMWLDGTAINSGFAANEPMNGQECAIVAQDGLYSSRNCSHKHKYICKRGNLQLARTLKQLRTRDASKVEVTSR